MSQPNRTQPMSDPSRPILIFTSEAGVEPHAAAVYSVGLSLKSLGYKVIAVQCRGVFNRCPAMDMHKVPYSEDFSPNINVCAACLTHSGSLLSHFGLESIQLMDFIDHDIVNTVNEQMALSANDLENFEYEGIHFGKASLIDFSLVTKVSNLTNLSGHNKMVWQHYIRASLLNYLLVGKIIDHLQVGAGFYFADYSINLGARFAGEKKGIPITTIAMPPHRVADLGKFIVTRTPTALVSSEIRKDFKRWENLPIPQQEVREIAEDTLLRLGAKGAHVYSPQKTTDTIGLIKQLDIDLKKKTLVAFTSSMDEYNAALKTFAIFGHPYEMKQTFPSIDGSVQIGWLKELIAYVEKSSDLQLIVRVHPREGANHREVLTSDHLTLLKNHFQKNFKNCRFIWPEDRISSYDLGELADLVLTTWTTIGQEFARLGVPVLASHWGITITDTEFIQYGRDAQDYFDKLETLLRRQPSLETIKQAYRFHASYLLRWAVDVSDIVDKNRDNGRPAAAPALRARDFEEVIIKGKDLVEIAYQRLSSQDQGLVSEQEEQALKTSLRQVVHFLMTGQPEEEDPKFFLIKTDLELSADVDFDQNERVFIVQDKIVHYVYRHVAYSRVSPLVARIIPFLSQNSLSLRVTSAEVETEIKEYDRVN